MKAENIKFRAKRTDDGEWVYGDLTHVQRICTKEQTEKSGRRTEPAVRIANYDVDEETIGQLIAKIRKSNGDICEVYSQDIVKLTAYDGEIQYVIVDDRGFVESKFLEFRTLIHFVDDFDVEWEVVGNIYDNKELLTQEYERID